MDQFQNLPYYLLTDLNDDPRDSDVACRAMENDMMRDLPADWSSDGNIPNTFCRDNVYEGMSGKDVSRIDTILSNVVGAHGCNGIEYLWLEGMGFDHVPIRAYLLMAAFHETISTIMKPVQLNLPDKPTNKGASLKLERSNDEHFCDIWSKHYDEKMSTFRANKDLTECHRLWSNHSYIF